MTRTSILRRDESGAAVIEFAIAVPILVSMIWGIFQLACLFWANAGMQNALGAGARRATLCIGGTATTECTAPTTTSVYNTMDAAKFGPTDGTMTVLTPVVGAGYMDLEVTYSRQMSLLFIPGPTVNLDRKKRVYTVS